MEKTDLAVGQGFGFIENFGQQLIQGMVQRIIADAQPRPQHPLGLFASGNVDGVTSQKGFAPLDDRELDGVITMTIELFLKFQGFISGDDRLIVGGKLRRYFCREELLHGLSGHLRSRNVDQLLKIITGQQDAALGGSHFLDVGVDRRVLDEQGEEVFCITQSIFRLFVLSDVLYHAD